MNRSEFSNETKSTSSSSSSIAPSDFNINNTLTESQLINEAINDENRRKSISDRIDGSNGKKWLLRCPVCNRDALTFFCSDCIKNGDFTYSKERFPERFAEKKLKYFKLKSEQIDISHQIEQQLEQKVIKDELEFKVRTLEANIENLNKSLSEAKKVLSNSRSNLIKMKQSQSQCKERQKKLMSKVSDAKQYIVRRQNAIQKIVESKNTINSYTKELLQQRITQLQTFIFPIETIPFDEASDGQSISNTETTPLLMVSESNNFNYNYKIVEPWISGNGDYSDFTFFAAKRRDNPNREASYRNPGYRIGAALAYITQLTNIIAFYLEIRLPKRLSYSEFFVKDLDETQFAHKVAKLNSNILYLCLSQNVDSELLRPRYTIKNLLQLLNSISLSGFRNGPILIKTDFLEAVEDSLLNDLYLIDEPDIEDLDSSDHDEELVEYDWVEHNLPDLHWTTSGHQTSIASGFMSTAAASVASFWRAATGLR